MPVLKEEEVIFVSRISFGTKKDATTKETREAIWQLSVKI